MAQENYVGVKQSLLGLFGLVDVDKGLKAIQFRTGIEVVDIDHVNKSALEGMLYVTDRGKVLDGITEDDKRKARYFFIPIGYKDKFTGFPLCASFMRSGYTWEGVFIGTVGWLVKRIMDNYEQKIGEITKEEREEIEKFNGYFPVKGFGLKEVLENNKKYNVNVKNYLDEGSTSKLEELKENLGSTKEEERAEYEIEKTFDKRQNDEYITVYDEIYSRLLIKENWRIGDRDRLRYYIKSLVEKIAYEQTREDGNIGNGYVLSEDRTKCLFNTGLIDEFNNDIYLIDLDNEEPNFSDKNIIMASSKAVITMYGFNKENILNMPKPVKFYEDKGDLIFDGTIDEFDLEDNYRLYHIIQERRGRFPEKYRDVNCDIIGDKIKNSIQKAVRLSERDYKYIVPMYNLKDNKIQYLLPLHLDRSIDEPPELAIVVGENNGFYSVYTILKTEDAYSNARLLCRPDSAWLRGD